MFFRMFQHLLPNARAWRTTTNKQLRQFFQGLSGLGADVKIFFDEIWTDLDPQQTRQLPEWECQFGNCANGLTEQQRRDRLDASWKASGGQDPTYIEETLQQNGFDVYLHEWWEPGTEASVGVKACATPRNPFLYLSSGVVSLVECGEPFAECGEPFAECGNSLSPVGFVLVNKIIETLPKLLTGCGELIMECGEPDASCGNFNEFEEVKKEYVIPDDPSKWPYFLYIGGQTFGTKANIEPKRRDEFEALCLKLCPLQQWLGMLIEYS